MAGFSAKIGPAGPILGGTDFGMTAQCIQLDILNSASQDHVSAMFLSRLLFKFVDAQEQPFSTMKSH